MPSVEMFFTAWFLITSLMFFAGLIVVWRLAGLGDLTLLRFLVGLALYVAVAWITWSRFKTASDGFGPAVILVIASALIHMTLAHPRWWRGSRS